MQESSLHEEIPIGSNNPATQCSLPEKLCTVYQFLEVVKIHLSDMTHRQIFPS